MHQTARGTTDHAGDLLPHIVHLLVNLLLNVLLEIDLSACMVLASSASAELVSSSARVTSEKFQQGVGVSELKRLGPINQTPGTHGSGKNGIQKMTVRFVKLF